MITQVGAVSASTTISNLSQPTLEIVSAFIMCFSMKEFISQALVRAVSKDEIETVESLLASGAPPILCLQRYIQNS